MGEFCESVEIEAHKSVQIQNEYSVIDDLKAKVSIEVESSIEELNQEIAPNLVLVVPKVESEIKFTDGTQFRTTCEEIHPDNSLSVNEVLVVDDSEVKIEEVPNEPGIQSEFSMVNSYPPNVVVDELAWEKEELVDNSTAMADLRMNSSNCLNFPSAHQVFVKMSAKNVSLTDGASEHVNGFSKISRDCLKFFVAYKILAKIPRRDVWVFDPGIAEILVVDSIDSIEVGIADFGENAYKLFEEMLSRGITMMGREYWNFDPGDVGNSKFAGFEQKGSVIVVGQDRFQWDPGGMCVFWSFGSAIEEVLVAKCCHNSIESTGASTPNSERVDCKFSFEKRKREFYEGSF